jgi:anaerobic selenocysteine-containing dehydrogenase
MSVEQTNATKPWQWQEGEYTVTRSSAWSGPGCHDGCSVLLYTKDGKLVKVEGDPESSYNQGRLCPRCLALPEVVNHPDRVTHPLKRVGERGENRWEEISWDEAYDTIAREFGKIKEKYGPESVIFAQGTGRDIMAYISRLAYSFGSPNFACLGLSGNACYLPRVALMLVNTGAFAVADCSQTLPDRYDDPRYKVPECMVVWGNNPLAANSDGFYGHWVIDVMKRGTKLVVIDPRLTWLASRADLWLQIRPGTDAALAMGFLNVIINENLYDHDFVEKWAYGFDELKQRVQDYPPSKVAEITWVPEEKIVAAARMYAESKPASIQWGLAIDMTKEALPAAHAITALWTITGNLDVPGGNILVQPPYGIWQSMGGWGVEYLSDEVMAKRFGVDKYPILNYGFLIAQADDLADAMITGEPYPVHGAWIQTNNPIACMSADPRKTYEGLSKMDFTVVVDLFMTPTATAFADIVLPAATFPEREGIRSHFWYYLGAINKVTQVGEAKSDMQINLELGKRFNPEMWPWKDVEEMYTDMIAPAGVNYEELKEKGRMIPPFEYRKYEKGMLRQDGQPGFNTPTGKVELYSTMMKEWELDPLPYFEEPPQSPVSTPEVFAEYPLVLTTGARRWGYFHSEHRQVPSLRELHPDPTVEIHPDTAAKYGIQDGDWVWIENGMGKCKQRAKLTPTVHPMVVSADHGWWFPERKAEEPELSGVWDSNINLLVPFDPGRSGFGGNYKALLCKIYKAE